MSNNGGDKRRRGEFKIAVLDKNGKFRNYLCEDSRPIKEIEFNTCEGAVAYIKEHHHPELTEYKWLISVSF